MSKKPTGLTISRSGGWYSASWKCGDKNYKSGQQFQYNINGWGWASLSIGKDTRAKGFSIDFNSYYPNTGTILYYVSIRIRGKKKGGSWSAWSTATYTNYVPNVPSLEASLDEQQTNKCTFTWNLATESTDARPYYHVRWETILVKESDVTDGSKLTWNSSALGWDTGAGAYASSVTMTEDTTLLADASYTRWFRVCGRGARGSSAWSYAKHVYARPYQAIIEHAEMSAAGAGGLTCYARWKADQTASHPIDYTTVQYLITVPNAGLTCPSGAQWSDANISADTKDTDAVRFSIDDVPDKDECLFVRVNTVHDTNVTYSAPKLASVGDLKDPTDLSYQVDNVNHTLTSVSVDNNSDVPDSFIAIVYRAGSNPEDELVVGIIPHGASQPLVTPVQCPDWSGESAFSIGAYAAVGTYEANSIGYTVKAKMRSASTIWVGGAVPVAPENVNVVQNPITGTATVTWDWTWEEARFAQLSWTDHDDAWESTDEPEIYNITKPKATKWNISGLELGKKWYIAVRLVSGSPDDENAIYSPWSDMKDIILSSVPNVPSLNLSARVITEGEEITASWDFVSNDGTGQISAEIKDEDNNLIAHTETQKEVVIATEALGWSQGETHSLSVRVTSESNRTTEWSNPVSIVVAKALEGSISETSLETKTVEVNPRSFGKTDFLSFLTEQEEVFAKLQVDLDPIQDLNGYDAPWVGGGGVNKYNTSLWEWTTSRRIWGTGSDSLTATLNTLPAGTYTIVGKIKIDSLTQGDSGDRTYGFLCTGVSVDGRTTLSAPTVGTVITITKTFTLSSANVGNFTNCYWYGGSGMATGDKCTVYDVGLNVESETNFTPYENICPISGHTEVDVVRTGKNLLDDSIKKLFGNQMVIGDSNPIIQNNRSAHLKAGTYTFSVTTSDGTPPAALYLGYTGETGDKFHSYNQNNLTFTLTEEKDVFLWAYKIGYIDVGVEAITSAQLELSTTATSYEPYNGQTYTTALGRTVYGGTLDLVSGLLTVRYEYRSAKLSSMSLISSLTTTDRYWLTNVLSSTGVLGANNWVCDSLTYEFTGNDTPHYYYVDSYNRMEVYVPKGTSTDTEIAWCGKLATPQTYQLTPQQIQTLLGNNNVWSEQGEVEGRIAEAARDVLSLTQMPLTVKLSGVNSNVTATVTIERTADYHMDRPDETQFDGYEGEIVFLTTQNSNEDIIINQEDLIGLMDDEAPYRIFVTFKDVYGQSMSDSVDFEVHWEHQAIIPEAEVIIDDENLIAKLTPIAPTGTLTGDTCDIYRLSADRPELIVKDAVFGTQYVDPYPAIGEFGGHRFVLKTVNGDYITATNDIAWTDTGIEEDDILDFDRTIIDFDGNQLLLYYNVDVGHQWDKDFQQTKYLGGSVQGDWNAGVSRSGSVSATMITLTDAEQIRMMRELAVYTGVCHVRTKDGSSYSADVQVSEDRDHDDYDKLVSFSLTITRVDTENLDGLTYEQWAQEEPDE